MFKSLYSGVSGLTANLTSLDVIGNNIANSNTTGFKSGRVTFNEMLTQTIRSASRPVSGGLGGTNPQQVGLGTAVGSIDTNFNQGNFTTTGNTTDLAIQGSGFFIMSDGTSNVYTRAGVFGLDSENSLVNPSTGLRVQGIMADDDGVLGTGPLEDIYIDPSLVVPASPSSSVQLIGNLDSASDAQGTVMQSASFMRQAAGTDSLLNLPLGVNEGDIISIGGQDGGGVDVSGLQITVTAGMTLDDLATALSNELDAQGFGPSTVDITDGAMNVTIGSGTIEGLSLNISGATEFNENFNFGFVDTSGPVAGDMSLAYADATTLATDLYDMDGNSLGLADGEVLELSGSAGTTSNTTTMTITGASTTLNDIMNQLRFNLGITSSPGEINSQGQMVLSGEPGLDYALSNIGVVEQGVENEALNSTFGFTATQNATDQQTFTMSTVTYDSLGYEHTMSFQFEKEPGLNTWRWTASMDGGEEITTGGSGTVSFNTDGSIAAFSFDNGASGITFDPNAAGAEGADPVTVSVDYGEVGALTGLTQFAGSGSLQAVADGYGTGTLVDFTIDQTGTITGVFSNDTMRNLARIGLATFSNASGLVREANNTYRLSGNSGAAVETFAGSGNSTTLVTGALETSNVDLATEFTKLVVAQRAFQANSRVITTSDQVMQELVNLVR